MAQNVIVPVIDLTSAAEGSSVPQNLQTALAFGSNTPFNIYNTTSNVALSSGFWRFIGVSAIKNQQGQCFIAIDDGTTEKKVWSHTVQSAAGVTLLETQFDFVLFLRPGDTVTIGQFISGAYIGDNSTISGSYRQIADSNGNLINPSGFAPQ